MIFQFAMLALAAGAAVAARDLGVARRMTATRAMARNRVEGLASVSCPAPVVGTVETDGTVEHWRVDPRGDRRQISDSVVFARPDGTRGVVVARATKLCVP